MTRPPSAGRLLSGGVMKKNDQDQPRVAADDDTALTRREFLQNASVLAVVAFAPLGCTDSTDKVTVPVGADQARFLSDTEMGTLRALVDTFLPPDGTPGGAEGGCADAIDALLAAF